MKNVKDMKLWEQLMEALSIFEKYADQDKSPFHCEHGTLIICNVDHEDVSESDEQRLEQLGFIKGSPFDETCFVSYRFGSA